MSKFQEVKAIIRDNPNLHDVQIKAYEAALSHYQEFTSYAHRETLIVMPTGTGKTGVMAILPFELSNGRVLIITPGKIVRKTVFKEFDTVLNPESTFWYKHKVVLDRNQFPQSYLYQGFNPKTDGEKERTRQKLIQSDIVITNIHKIVGSNDEVNLLELVDENFFDMIIIDEAHHVAADMWQNTLDYFKATKVIKLTATPFRGDKLEISTHPYDPIYEYTLGEAINDGLVKNVVKGEDIPGTLEFFHTETKESLSLEQAKQQLGNDWVSKKVAMSEKCSKQVIEHTKEILNLKKTSYSKHQVLAITCNDEHAQDVTVWFQESGLSCTYVSSRLSDKEIEQRLNDFANGIYDVMVSIQMLGEGYDNPNISIISIFRPFKTISPYAQAIGRGLRRIRNEQVNDIDNYCDVVYHQELSLEKLWEYYKDQESYGEIIKKQLESLTEQLSFSFDELGFVEKKQGNGKKSSSAANEDDSIIIRDNTGRVSTYQSKGFGKVDSFTLDGVEKYHQARNALIAENQKALDEKRSTYYNLYESGAISKEESDVLIANIEAQFQNQYNKSFTEFRELVVSETLRKDFISWLNIKTEEFFKISALSKDGFELSINENGQFDNGNTNNIGFIIKNLYQSLYQSGKRNISMYTSEDFAAAKKRFTDKISYYIDQYGRKREDDLE